MSHSSAFSAEEAFKSKLEYLGITENDYSRKLLVSIYLLMKGKFITHLVDLLHEPNVRMKIKLLVCQFFIEEGYSETNDIVSKILKENVTFDLTENEPI